MMDKGASGNDIGVTLLVVVAALLMAATPFAMEKAKSWGEWAAYLVFGIGLCCVNYALAVGAVGKVRDLGAGPAREKIIKAAALDASIERETKSRNQLPQVRPSVDRKMLDAADEAVRLADEARKQECGKVGDNCRARVAELKAATEARAPLLAAKATADAIDKADGEIQRLEKERRALGDIPDTVDAQAARLAKVAGKFVDLGVNPIEAVADAVISILAVFAELIGLAGPRIIMTAIGRGEAPDRPERSMWSLWPLRRLNKLAAPVSAAPAPAAVEETPATPAPVRKARKPKASALREFGDVREWHRSRTVARNGTRTKPGDAYKAYTGWCVEHGKVPVSLTAFGSTMKAKAADGGCGVIYEERSKRGFYVDLVVVSGPRLAVSNA
jgi:hypothetical protein